MNGKNKTPKIGELFTKGLLTIEENQIMVSKQVTRI